MPVSVSWTNAVIGKWVQVAEYRPLRQALWIEYLAGAVIYSPTTNVPMISTEMGIIPAGTYRVFDKASGGPPFHLSRIQDGELVQQAWFAWVITALTGGGQQVTHTIEANGALAFPNGAIGATLICQGLGGGSTHSTPGAGACGGGGGGAYARTDGFTVPPGGTLTYQCPPSEFVNPIPQPDDTWISLTGVAPTTIAEGCLAQAGRNGRPAGVLYAAPGGQAANSIGTTKFSGGRGGTIAVWDLVSWQTGGGGGGVGNEVAGGGDGAPGLNGVHPGSAGGVPFGGLGGANDGSSPEAGFAGDSGGGCGGSATNGNPVDIYGQGINPTFAIIIYTDNGGNPIMTAESFLSPPEPPPPPKTIAVPLPRLSDSGKLHLRSLRNKLENNDPDSKEGIDDGQNPSEYD